MESEDARSTALRLLLSQVEALAQRSKAWSAERRDGPLPPTPDEVRALDAALARESAAGTIEDELLRRVAALEPILSRYPPNEITDVVGYQTIRFEQAVTAARSALGLGVAQDAQKLSRRLIDRLARGAAPAATLEAGRQDLLRLLGADRVRWFVFDTTRTVLVSAWTTDAREPVRLPTASSTLPCLVASEGRPVSLAAHPSGLERSTWYPEEEWVPERAPWRTNPLDDSLTADASPSWALAVPLWRGMLVIGVLEFSGRRPDAVTPTDVSVASLLARPLGEVLGP